MRHLFKLSVIVFLIAFQNLAHAHHTAGHGMSGPSFNPITSVRTPKTIVGLGVNADSLDSDQGYAVAYKISGEYALNSRWSLGAIVPVSTVRTTGLQHTGLADVSLLAKGVLWQNMEEKIFLLGGTSVSVPTGNKNSGLGAGDVLVSPSLTVAKGLKRLNLFSSVGSSVAMTHEVRPSLDYAVGSVVTLVPGEYPLEAVFSVQGSSIFGSNTFQNGSTKIYLSPALIFPMTTSSRLTVGGKFAVVDELKLKSGVVLSSNSTALFTDIRSSVFTNLDVFF